MKVCVTGATGFIARHIIFQLLQAGHTVVGTVRSVQNEEKMRYLKFLQSKFPSHLHLFEANLNTMGDFDKPFQNCDAVIHVASPYKFLPNDTPEEEMHKKVIDPALNGTRNVMASCAKNNIRILVFTSSVFATANTFSQNIPPILDQYSWNSDRSINEAGDAYHFSKTAAEKLAWELFNKDLKPHGAKMAAIHPVYVLGSVIPVFDENEVNNTDLLNEGLEIFHNLMTHKQDKVFDISIGVVNVHDVAELHIKAVHGLISGAVQSGDRFQCSCEEMRFIQVVKRLNKLYPQYKVTEQVDSSMPSAAEFKVDTNLAKRQLGITFKDVDSTLKEMVESFRQLKFVK